MPTSPELKAKRREYGRKQRLLHRERCNAFVRASRKRSLIKDPDYERRRDLKKMYGITVEWYNATLAAQDYKCAICRCPAEQNSKRQGRTLRLSVDHCHTTSRVRGLLCNNCNRAIGLLEHDIGTLHSAVAYLLKGLS